MNNKRMTYTDRLKLETMYNANMPVKVIANKLGFSFQAIYYELKKGFYMHRNSDWTETKRYSCDKAQEKTEYEQSSKGASIKLANDYEFVKFFEDMIKQKYSPNAILGYIKLHNLEFKTNVCRATLYSYIDKGLFLNVTNKDLLRKGKKKKKYRKVRAKKAPAGTSIEKRPKYIEERKEFGHWELDTVVGKRKKGEVLFVLTERMTRYEIIYKAKDKTAHSLVFFLNKLERKYKKFFPQIFKTITVDNGSEFAYCDEMENSSIYKNKKRTQFYYCHPYSSYERGSNENQNAFIRRFLPKGTEFEPISQKRIDDIANFINTYPRELLNFNNSENLFLCELHKLDFFTEKIQKIT
ncbi:MAG: IS30 family transposase [Clostridia bacterium]|nr:IS30 family transposase [Clostridia bacterium]MBO5440061.1 IS30 family transposase [Clostridia bacterium]